MSSSEEKEGNSHPEEWKVLLEKWGLKKYIPKFEENEWTYPEYWMELDKEKLASIGMQDMSRSKFQNEVSRSGNNHGNLWKNLTNEERAEVSTLFEVTNDFSDSTLLTLIMNQINKIKNVKKLGTQLKLHKALDEWVSAYRENNINKETYKIWDRLNNIERVAIREAFNLTTDIYDKALVHTILNSEVNSIRVKSALEKVTEGVDTHIKEAALAIAKFDKSACKDDKLIQAIKGRKNKNNALGTSFALGIYTTAIGLGIAEDAGLIVAGAIGPVGWWILAGFVVGFLVYNKLSDDPTCVKDAKSWFHITESDDKMNAEELMKVLKKRVKIFMKSGDHPDRGGNDEITIQTNFHFKILLSYYNKNIKNEADMNMCIRELKL